MVYTLTLNPALDYELYCRSINNGRTNRAFASRIRAGGKGINVSLMLKNLGTENIALGLCAGFTGDELLRELTSCGLECDFVKIKDGTTRINMKVVSKDCGDETEINAQGPYTDEESLDMLFKKLKRIESGDVLIMSGSVPPPLSFDIYSDIMKRFSERGIIFITDVAGRALSSVLLNSPYLIKPNLQEAEEFFGVGINDITDAAECAVYLREKGASNVMISLGKNGSVYASESGRVYRADVPVFESAVSSASGAGDSMIGGFVHAVLSGYSEEDAFRYANASGCATVVNGGIAGREEVLTVFEKIRITKL